MAFLYVSMKLFVRETAEHSKLGILAHVLVDGVAGNAKVARCLGRLIVVAGKRLRNLVVANWSG